MQGQFKTPGGKLVVVDFEIENGLLQRVVVHGDFFLYPDDAFNLLAESLEGAPIESSEDALAERVRRALDGKAELIGSSPEAIATAIARGIAAEREVTS
jgi:lipoate-protein ligase A